MVKYTYIYIYMGRSSEWCLFFRLPCRLARKLSNYSIYPKLGRSKHKESLCSYLSSMTSATVANEFARYVEANKCPSGRTTGRLWISVFNSCAMRLWISDAKSDLCALKRNTSSPAKLDNFSIERSSSKHCNCKIRSPPLVTGSILLLPT